MSHSSDLATRVQFDHLDANTRLHNDLEAIYNTEAKVELELLVVRLEAEKAARTLFKLLGQPVDAIAWLEGELLSISRATTKSELEIYVLRLQAEKAAREINDLIQPR